MSCSCNYSTMGHSLHVKDPFTISNIAELEFLDIQLHELETQIRVRYSINWYAQDMPQGIHRPPALTPAWLPRALSTDRPTTFSLYGG